MKPLRLLSLSWDSCSQVLAPASAEILGLINSIAFRARERKEARHEVPPHHRVRRGCATRLGRSQRGHRGDGGARAAAEPVCHGPPLHEPRRPPQTHFHASPGHPAVFRPGPATRLRIQSRGSDPLVHARRRARSHLRHVLLGDRTRLRPARQRAHGLGKRSRRLCGGAKSAGAHVPCHGV